ncbi:WD40 repeat-like protein [Irpex rosettiformis]|uniref:WD40 repeat-like protein n=1 Tax=Irpex rosettiformis TaxID=378272 RepID=A0ACB8TQ13_9APHY|nr:WD40 repeat-like protein [Irpex rosettiformis]
MTATPTPSHLLRTHLASVNCVSFSPDNERLYSADASGNVVVTSTRSFRPIAQWRAHTDSILGVEEWEGQVITHGRDNKLHVWTSTTADSDARVGDSATASEMCTPTLSYSMDVNALNYCRFSLMPLPPQEPEVIGARALIAVPNLVESHLADIWELPSRDRMHAAIGKASMPELTDGRGINPIGIIMSMHLFEAQHANTSGQTQLRLLCSYENGGVMLYGYSNRDKVKSVEGLGWELLWNAKLHVESVMAMAVSRDKCLALTVSADHLIGRYDLEVCKSCNSSNVQKTCIVHRTKYPGNASIAIRDDGRVCAIGGWDGKVRLFSTKTLKPLGTLGYHKKSAQAVSFARSFGTEIVENAPTDVEDSEDEMSEAEKAERRRWLAVGSQDSRVSLWSLISFDKK